MSAPLIPAETLIPRTRTRGRTISIKRLSKRALDLGRRLYPEAVADRPATRAECQGAERPCPYVSCKHHLYLDVNERTGSIKLNFPDLEVWEMPETCALDVAEGGGSTLEEVGEMMNITRERIRQLETRIVASLAASLSAQGIEAPDLLPDDSDDRWVDARGQTHGSDRPRPLDPVRFMGITCSR